MVTGPFLLPAAQKEFHYSILLGGHHPKGTQDVNVQYLRLSVSKLSFTYSFILLRFCTSCCIYTTLLVANPKALEPHLAVLLQAG